MHLVMTYYSRGRPISPSLLRLLRREVFGFVAAFPALPRDSVPAAAAQLGPKPQSRTSVTGAAARVLTSLTRPPRTGSSEQRIPRSRRDVTAEETDTLTHICVSPCEM